MTAISMNNRPATAPHCFGYLKMINKQKKLNVDCLSQGNIIFISTKHYIMSTVHRSVCTYFDDCKKNCALSESTTDVLTIIQSKFQNINLLSILVYTRCKFSCISDQKKILECEQKQQYPATTDMQLVKLTSVASPLQTIREVNVGLMCNRIVDSLSASRHILPRVEFLHTFVDFSRRHKVASAMVLYGFLQGLHYGCHGNQTNYCYTPTSTCVAV